MSRSSPEQIISTVDPQNFFEGANLLWKIANLPRGSQRFRVLAGLRDAGEANAIIPVLSELSVRSFDIFVMATERGEDELKASELGFSHSRYFNPMLRIERMRGNAAISGFSGVPSIEMALNSAAHARGVKVFAIEDYPGAYLSKLRDVFSKTENAIPDYLFVGNNWAREANLSQYPNFPEDRIIVTGAPAMDKIAHINKAKVRKAVRKQLGVRDDETLITWFGQVRGATLESLQILLKGLEILNPKNYRLATRFHPRDDNPQGAYDAILRPVRNRHIDASRAVEPNAPRIITASDLVIQERSTIAMEAAALGVPVISIAIPEINEKYGVMVGLRVPVIEDGTSPLVSREGEMAEVLKQVLFDNKYRNLLATRMQFWIPDGKAAERVANKIIGLVV